MFLRVFCVALALLAASASASTNSAKSAPAKASYDMTSLDGPRALAEQVMKDVIAGRMDGFVESVMPHTMMTKEEVEKTWQKSLEQRKAAQDRLGRTLGYRFIGEKRVGDFAVRYSYVEKRAKHILRWQFTFYKPNDKWTLNAFMWDDNINPIFE